jgi:hypothetical protein
LLDSPNYRDYLAGLSPAERSTIENEPDDSAKLFYARFWTLRDRASGLTGELEPLLAEIEANTAASKQKQKTDQGEAAERRTTRTQMALALLARCWVQVGPYAGLSARVEGAVVLGWSSPDELVRLQAAALAWAMKAAEPGREPGLGVGSVWKSIRSDRMLQEELDSQINVLREAARAAGRNLPSK